MSSSAPLEPNSRESNEILSLAQAQYETAGTIFGSNDPAEILDALVSFTQQTYEEAQLCLLEDATISPYVVLLAEYKEQRVTRTRTRLRLDQFPASDTYSAIEELNITNVSLDPFLEEIERQRLLEEGVQSLLITPMVVSQRLTGIVLFRSRTNVQLSPARLRALRNLVDQAAVVFENQSLLRNTETSLEEVQALYEINRAMLAAVDTMDILRVLRQKLAQDADTILHIAADDTTTPRSFVLRQITTRDNESDVKTLVTLSEGASWVLETPVLIIENAAAPAMPHPLHEALKAYAPISYVVMNIRERGEVQDLIAITFKTQFSADARTQRLYTAVADQITIVLQNQHLLMEAQISAEQANRQLERLQILNRLSSGLSSLTDQGEVMQFGTRLIAETVNVDHAGMMLLDKDQSMGTVVTEFPDIGAVGQRLPMATNPLSQILLRDPSRAVYIEDIATDERLPEMSRMFLHEQSGLNSMIIIPMVVQDHLIGSLGLDIYERGRVIDPELIQVATAMTSQLAIAVENARLLADSTMRAVQLQRVTMFSQNVQATMKQDEIFEVFFAEVNQLFGLDSLMIALYDRSISEMRVAAQRRSANDTQPFSVSIPLTNTLYGLVAQTGKTFVSSDVAQDSGGLLLPNASFNTRSVMIAPIQPNRQPLGQVMVTSSQIGVYTETDVAILEQIVTQLGIALQNSRAYAETQRAARNQALINTISAQYQQQSSLENMLTLTLRELGRALGARRARARFLTAQDSIAASEERT